MMGVATTFKKELRSYFSSPVALIFLAMFLVITLFVFFTYGRFFSRNIADVRPLFEWLPILLIFLVSAITMRAWSEEQKLGTLEILMTLPVKTPAIAIGKLLAGIVLVVLALALTLPLPITVSFLGDIDWGPVIGGYLGALLLAGTYLAIGMCVSSRTDNQVVALMVTVVFCGLLYIIGSDSFVAFFGDRSAELLRSLGSGSRFESIERGVLDIRDFIYYGSLIAFFTVLNVHFLETKRRDTFDKAGKQRWTSRWLTVGLMGLNAIGVNFWLAPVTAARADLTEDGEYSVSDATVRILSELSEPLTISGYFSEKTHPLLAPLVPRIRDFLTEYEVRGRGKVKVNFQDPNKDEELEKEIAELYDIKSVPFRVSARHEESVVNSYFHILIEYGDQHQVLSFNDLIEIYSTDTGVDVKLSNLEYDITKSIKKVSQGFQSIESMFATLTEPAKLKLFITPSALPEEFKKIPEQIQKVAKELTDESGGKFIFEETDVTGKDDIKQEILDKYGFKPLAADLFGEHQFYLHLLLQTGPHLELIYLPGESTEASVRTSIEASIKRGTPGFLKTIGLLTAKPTPTPPNPNMPPGMQPPQPRPEYQIMEHALSEELTVKRIEATDGIIPGDIDALIVARPGPLTDKQQFAIDQYLMRGGALVVLAGAYKINTETGSLNAVKSDPSFTKLLEKYGVQITDAFALDKQNARFPIPIREDLNGIMMERIVMMDYPFFPDIRRDGFASGHIALSGLQNVVLNWSSPLQVKENLENRNAEVLLSSSKDAWEFKGTEVLPTSLDDAETAFQPTGEVKQYPLAVVITGRFPSFFSDRPSPLFNEDSKKPEEQDTKTETIADASVAVGADAGPSGVPSKEKIADRTGRTIKESTSEAKIAVVGSSEFATDLVASLSDQLPGSVYRNNMQLVRNLVDWALADTDLLSIRGSGAFARTLKPMEEDERNMWEFFNYIIVLVALGIVVAVAAARRRKARKSLVEEVAS